MGSYILAVDVGGTFTDIVLSDLETGGYRLLKTPSTPEDPARGFLQGISRIMDLHGVSAAEISRLLHGTTIATNAILEGDGAQVGLIVSEGFRYVLEIGRHSMARLANPYTWVKPERPVPPEHVVEVPERTEFTGEVLIPLNEEIVCQAGHYFYEKGINTIAVALLHSYANPQNERRVRELLLDQYPEMQVSLSSDVLPVFREYERTITTVLNAYVTPKVSSYIGNLTVELGEQGLKTPLLIMKSNGGVIGAESAVRQPVYTALSGPAAGVMAAAQIGRDVAAPQCISLDMGGTSTDVALISQYQPTTSSSCHLGQWPLQIPMLDIATIGAGGGSIAWLTPAGHLSVGPRSAGASPGPVCYGHSGTEPTVTDANLVLGRVGQVIADGTVALDVDAASRAIREKIALPLGLELEQAASGILQIVNNAMMGAIRNVSVERGHDPRAFALIPFGGAGPMHAVGVAELLYMSTVVVPRHPGVASAYGLMVADLKNDYSRTFLQKPPYDLEAIENVLQELESLGTDWLAGERVAVEHRDLTRAADLRYTHQGFEVTVELEGSLLSPKGISQVLQNFHEKHQELFGFSLDQPVEIVTLRVTAAGKLGVGKTPELPLSEDARAAQPVAERSVYFEEAGGFTNCSIFSRQDLGPGREIVGPAILEGADSTVVIHPGWQGRVDDYGNCILTKLG